MKVKTRKNRVAGYRILGEKLAETEKACLFSYHGWEIWLPKSALVLVTNGDFYTAPAWAIDSGKDHPSATREARA